MPVISLTLEDTEQTIYRQALVGIIKDLIRATGIPQDVSRVMYNDLNLVKTDNENSDQPSKRKKTPRTVHERKVFAEIEENFRDDSLGTTAIHQVEHGAVFSDEMAEVSMWPIYANNEMTVRLTYTTPSKTEAIAWRDRAFAKLNQYRNILSHEIEYDIFIPEVGGILLEAVYDNRNRLIPQDLDEYIITHSTNRLYVASDLKGVNKKLAIRERQARIVGKFDFSPMPDKFERQGEDNTFRVTLNYQLSFEKPIMMGLRYPILVFNKTLPYKFLEFLVNDETKQRMELHKDRRYSLSLHALSNFEAHRFLERQKNPRLPTCIPDMDHLDRSQYHPGYGVVTSILCDVDETDNRTLLDLTNIDDHYIPQPLLDWMLANPNKVTQPYQSIVYLGLQKRHRFFNHPNLEISSEGVVSSSTDLDLHGEHRVLFNILLNLSYVRDHILQDLKDHPDLALFYVKEYLLQVNNFTEIKRQFLQWDQFKTFVDLIATLVNSTDLVRATEMLSEMKKHNRFIYFAFLSFMKNNFPNTLSGWIHQGILVSNDVPNNQHYKGLLRQINNGFMKTQFNTFVVAERKE